MYKYRYDIPNAQWNVYLVKNGREEFIDSFATVDEARNYCTDHNSALITLAGQ